MLILGSSSKGRLDILNKLGIRPDLILSPDIDETPLKKEMPKMLSLRLAKAKGLKLSQDYPNDIIISADTVVCVGRRIIDKCITDDDVKKAMEMLSGRSHRIYTTVCITNGEKQKFRTAETRVKFKRLTPKEIEDFIKTGEGIGKAGGYTINGRAEGFVLHISGSVSGVIGLPSYETLNLLRSVLNYI
jgi:septum formation protein